MQGKFITLEGCEGCGKSTQIEYLKEYFKNNNIDCLFTREPGGNDISEKIRSIILDINNKAMSDECEALLYAAARAQLASSVIIPALKEGKIVVCDRYIDSSFAYQAYARKLGFDYINGINKYVVDNLMPDCTIFLDITPTESFLRKGGADTDDRLEQQGLKFHNEVYNGYKELEKKYPQRFVSINSRGTKEETLSYIIKALKDKEII